MPNSEYNDRVDHLVRSWKDDIYDGVLMDAVLPAVQTYAYASLQQVSDVYDDVPDIFPMFSEQMGLHDHYGNALFSRLSSACTSVRNALQAVQARMDYHAAIAIARRAHESLWQMFWIANPTKDGDTRIRRVLILNKREIAEALPIFTDGINPEVEQRLRYFGDNIEKLIGRDSYLPRHGRSEYHRYFTERVELSSPIGTWPVTHEVDAGTVAWRIMSNITHPNVVFDWLTQKQYDFRSQVNRYQMILVVDAMAMVANLGTMMMVEAKLPIEHIEEVNPVLHRPVVLADELLELRRD